MFQTKAVQKIKTHILCSVTFFRKSCRLWDNVEKNIVERGRPQVAIWRMRVACWVPKVTNTHSQYVILIAFPLQQWLSERVTMLHYTYIGCLVINPLKAELNPICHLLALIGAHHILHVGGLRVNHDRNSINKQCRWILINADSSSSDADGQICYEC